MLQVHSCNAAASPTIISDMRRSLSKIHTAPKIISFLCDSFTSLPPAIIQQPQSQFDHEFNTAATMKNSLGALQCAQGRLTLLWTTPQSTYTHSLPRPTNLTLQTWQTITTRILLTCSIALWNSRNSHLHNSTQDNLSARHAQLKTSAQNIYHAGSSHLLHGDRGLLHIHISTILNLSFSALQQWTNQIHAAQAAFQIIDDINQRNQPLITRFFPATILNTLNNNSL